MNRRSCGARVAEEREGLVFALDEMDVDGRPTPWEGVDVLVDTRVAVTADETHAGAFANSCRETTTRVESASNIGLSRNGPAFGPRESIEQRSAR